MTNLHNLIECMRGNLLWIGRDGGPLKTQYPEQYNWLLGESMAAVCFDMGSHDNSPDLKVVPDLFYLPYPVVWFECLLEDGILGLLASQVGEKEYAVAVVNKYMHSTWSIGHVVKLWIEGDDLNIKSHAQFSDGSDEELQSDLEYSGQAIGMMAKFIMAMNCSNVQRQEHKAPKHINAKRINRGRQPIFSYWTLHIPAERREDSACMGGTHASPRLHLRRGHIRRYADGKYTWVNACVVGKKELGVIAKDYAFTGT